MVITRGAGIFFDGRDKIWNKGIFDKQKFQRNRQSFYKKT